MTNLPGYQLFDQIDESVKAIIYRGEREEDRQAVIVKVLRDEYPPLDEIARLKRDYEISKNLDLAGTLQPIAMESYRNSLALISSDPGGEFLNQFLSNKKLKLTQFLNVAIQLADILAQLYTCKIIHKNIKPQNILFNSETNEVKIADFSIAKRLSRETLTGVHPTFLEGTLAYISPEQTGRMNRAVDYRSDFYSLGVAFYEMLTGQLPFQTAESNKLIACHLAKTPVPPCQVTEIPRPISDIVMKLMSKNAEDRYQSAYGLKADLQCCLNQLESQGKISEFQLGRRDRSDRLQIPKTLYGRDREMAVLMQAFQTARSGGRNIVLVCGDAGIGKSALVQAIAREIAQQQGMLIAGKFEQFKAIPYSAIARAFQSLIRQLLAERSDKLALWRQNLLSALGENGRVAIDIIPEIELIIGEQPPVPKLGVTETKNRFQRVFQSFVRLFCQHEHPLVLFLDDLQRADSDSLQLIQQLLSNPENQHFLLLGTYRPKEVGAQHPLTQTMAALELANARVDRLRLDPLSRDTIGQILADTLQESVSSPQKPLADFLFDKTRGNPFFLKQLLQTLYDEKLLAFDFEGDRWQWNMAQIRALELADSPLLKLVTRKIQQLPADTINLLQLAACLGNPFNLDLLARASEQTLLAAANLLQPALQAGLILPLNHTSAIAPVEDRGQAYAAYKFVHDRIQQAAYRLIESSCKPATHLKIGRLLSQAHAAAREEYLFEIANQLNLGSRLLAEGRDRQDLAKLNLKAGQKAKATSAYKAAARYLRVGLRLLGEASWEREYDLTLALHVEAAEAEYLMTRFHRAAAIADIVLQHASAPLDRLKIYEVQIQAEMAQNQPLRAIDAGQQALEQLDVSPWSAPPNGNWLLPLPSLEDLERIPLLDDPRQIAILRLLMQVASPLYNAQPERFPTFIFTAMHICLTQGRSPLAAQVYAMYGLVLCASTAEIDTAYLAGQLALKLLDQFNARQLKCKVYELVNAFIRPWKDHLYATLAPLLEGLQSGLETGDLEYAGYCILVYSSNLFFVADDLQQVARQQSHYLDLLLALKQEYPIDYVRIWRQASLNFLGQASRPKQLVGDSCNEVEMLPHWQAANNRTLLFAFHLVKTLLLYLWRSPQEAARHAAIAAEHLEAVAGWSLQAIHNFYQSLSLLALCPTAQPEARSQYLAQVEANQTRMQHWASHAPMNYQHKYDLVEAEKLRYLDRPIAAMDCYDRALNAAKTQGYLQEAALTAERAADFYFALGRQRLGQVYLEEASYLYQRWGAKAKVQQLQQQYSPLELAPFVYGGADLESGSPTDLKIATPGSITALDLAAIRQATLALADEIAIDKLLDKLLAIVMESAGATNSALILEQSGQLTLLATGDIDREKAVLHPSPPIEQSDNLPLSLLYYTRRTQSTVVLNCTTPDRRFGNDAYLAQTQPQSLLCMPIFVRSASEEENCAQLMGLLYLENPLTAGAFTDKRLEVLKLLSAQIAISLKKALLYANLETATADLKRVKSQLEDYSRTLEHKVQARTRELQEKNQALEEQAQQLERALRELRKTQGQLIQTEKMSSLGQLVAGIAHEINNPIGFIYSNLPHAETYFQDLLQLLESYQQKLPDPDDDIEALRAEIDLAFLRQDLPHMLGSMQSGASRIRQIVESLRNFSHLDEEGNKPTDLHQGLDSTLLMLQYRLTRERAVPITVVKKYGQLPPVNCNAGQMNQVFINILTNAIDAIAAGETDPPEEDKIPTIEVRTAVREEGQVEIAIADNGRGMSEDVRSRIFDPFFTTKAVGGGTGLGLSTCYQIVVEKHGGELECHSRPRKGTTFTIALPVKDE